MSTSTRNDVRHVHPALFLAAAMLFSWCIWLPITLAHFDLINFPVREAGALSLIGVLGPAITAVLFTRVASAASVRSLSYRLTIARVPLRWWFAAAVVQPALLLAIALVHNRAGLEPSIEAFPDTETAFLVNIVFLLIATLGEEIGWRGVALPGLLLHMAPLHAGLVLGTVWAFWHLPYWLTLDSFDDFGWPYLLMNVLSVIPVSVYITWIFVHTKESLLLPVAFHVTFNVVNVSVFQVTSELTPYWTLVGVQWALAGAIVAKYGATLGGSPNRVVG